MIPIFKPSPGDEELNEIEDTFRSHWIGLGPKTKRFEEEFCKYTGAKNAISTNSCTVALHLCLVALGIKEGDEVLISSITFASTGHVVIQCGAIPILVDVNEDDLQMNIEDLKRKITPRTKAIIPVHYGGIICDIDQINEIAKEHNLYVIEDAANCTGAEYKEKKIGNLDSDFTCFSFEAKKNMTTGDGGMITTNKEGEIIDKIRRLRWVGMDKDTSKRFSEKSSKPWEYDIKDLGYKYNMNDITASIGLVQLKKLDDMNNKRIRLVERYNQEFKDIAWLKTLPEKPYAKNVYWLYILRIEQGDREKFMQHLFDNEVLANTSFSPLHLFSFYKNYYEKKWIIVNCPVAEQEWKKLAVLPLYPDMTDEEQNKVIEVVKSFKQNSSISEEKEENISKTDFEGVLIINPKIFEDGRGYFYESYNIKKFEEMGLPTYFVQDNQSMSNKGVLRGLHFQKPPYEQGKLVRVVKGRVLDVVVDLRRNSFTFGKWFSIELSEDNKKMLWIPPGFAHGFLSLENNTIFQYKCTANYNKEADSGIIWNDPYLRIDWQFEKFGIKEPTISEKDRNLPLFS